MALPPLDAFECFHQGLGFTKRVAWPAGERLDRNRCDPV